MSEKAPRVTIVDPNPAVEDILRKMDARVNQTILGPNGKPILEPVVEDRTLTYSKGGEKVSLNSDQWMYAVGRMARDGMSMDQIRAELDIPKRLVDDRTLSRGIKTCVAVLESAIRDGIEPEESQRVVGYRVVEDDDGAID